MSVLERIEAKVKEWLLEVGSKEALQMSQSLSPGKMLRSKLILAIAGESEESLSLCAAVELIQSASLLHDDVIDDAFTRRGKPSINAVFGSKNAIMLGDIFYSKAFFELTRFSPLIARTVSHAVVRLSRGELADVTLAQTFNLEEHLYMQMIEDKTASLIEAAAQAAALLVSRDSEAFRIYGKNLGLAFQIIDDLLDITQDSTTLGKPALNDFCEGKSTLPYIYLHRALDSADKARLEASFARTLAPEEAAWIKEKMHEHGAIAQSYALARSLGLEAIEQIRSQKCEKLEVIMREMIEREF